MKRLSLFFILLFPLTSLASDLELTTDLKEKHSLISASYEYSQFKLNDGTISGYGLRMTYGHAMNSSWYLEAALSAALNNQGSLQNSFTGIGGYGYYSLLGDQYHTERRVLVNNVTLIKETRPSRHNVLIGAGLMQYFLNGNRGVYSSSGAGVGFIYKFDMGSWNLRVSGRYHMMTAAQVDVKTLNFDLGIAFPL